MDKSKCVFKTPQNNEFCDLYGPLIIAIVIKSMGIQGIYIEFLYGNPFRKLPFKDKGGDGRIIL
jgi:hypothetical protein